MDKTKRGAESNYSIMTFERLKEIPYNIISENAFICLWVPNVLSESGLELLKHWNFQLKGIYGWIKTTINGKLHFGMGHTFRGTFEICFYGSRGKLEVNNHSQRNIAIDDYNFGINNFDFDINFKHSKKTEKLQDSLDLIFPHLNKLEVFARRIRNGWTCIGNEIDGLDIFQSIKNLENI